MNLRNISWAMGLVLLGSVAMPSLARKKVQPVQKPAVQEDHLSPNDRQRYNYFFLEGARQQAAGNYSAAFDLFEHAGRLTRRRLKPISMSRFSILSSSRIPWHLPICRRQ